MSPISLVHAMQQDLSESILIRGSISALEQMLDQKKQELEKHKNKKIFKELAKETAINARHQSENKKEQARKKLEIETREYYDELGETEEATDVLNTIVYSINDYWTAKEARAKLKVKITAQKQALTQNNSQELKEEEQPTSMGWSKFFKTILGF
jgi:hypothetical protein